MDKNMPILVVDDFSTMRRIVKTSLSQLCFDNVAEAEDGVIALNMLKLSKFSFIISDWNMPNMRGIDLLKAVRADEELMRIPFVMITAESQQGNIIEAAQAGVS
ncbi:MAG: response regulator, partial [SAR324 cluster bacterium]|nr:response regulator [SAR324 cluster bacterium]